MDEPQVRTIEDERRGMLVVMRNPLSGNWIHPDKDIREAVEQLGRERKRIRKQRRLVEPK